MRFTRETVWIFDVNGEEQAEVLIDHNNGVAYVREESERHYVGTFGRETAVYGRNPHGAAWYRLEFNPRIPLQGDGTFVSGAWEHSKGRQGNFSKILDGQFFRALENAWEKTGQQAAEERAID